MGALVKKLSSPTYGVDGSSRTAMGALVLKFTKSYPRGGRTIKGIDKCHGLKIYQVLSMGCMDH